MIARFGRTDLGSSGTSRASHVAGVVFGSTQPFPPVLSFASLYPAGGGDGSRGFVLVGIEPADFSRIAVSEAGDVNGDGIDDVIIGASAADPGGRRSAGESYVVFGRNTTQ